MSVLWDGSGKSGPLPSARHDPILADLSADSKSDLDLEDFFENGALPLHMVGPDGTILRANKAELALMGYTADGYVGRNIAEFHVDREAIGDILARLTRGEKLEQIPARLRARDGSIRDVRITSSAQFRDGKFVNSRCFTTDVSELRRTQLALEESERRLQDLLARHPGGDLHHRRRRKDHLLQRSRGRVFRPAPDRWQRRMVRNLEAVLA